MKFLLKYVFFFSIVLLSGCQDKLQSEYLMVHPALLEKEASRCQLMFMQRPQNQTQACKMVLDTYSKFMAIVTEQEVAPEEFGKRIIREEMELAKIKQKLDDHRKEVELLKRTRAESSIIINAVTKLTQLERRYKDKKQTVDVLLAVIGKKTPG